MIYRLSSRNVPLYIYIYRNISIAYFFSNKFFEPFDAPFINQNYYKKYRVLLAAHTENLISEY